jgi:DNA polymerase-1
MARTLLIDADVVAYNAAMASEKATDWGDGYWTWHCNFEEVVAKFDEQVASLVEHLEADDYKLCLTDSEGNFRFSVLPSYKGNRAGTKKPLVLKAFKQFLIDERSAYFRPGLEGDDCMGILATVKGSGERIIVSIDKDMKTIPGLYFRDRDTGIVSITEAEAEYWHMYQTLIGDTTDGYKGCPGCGPVEAERVLRGLIAVRPYAHEIKSGKRKGEIETRWADDEADDMWDVVVSQFLKAGLSEKDALQQARVARILQASDYDFKKKEPILWRPKLPA